MSELDARYPGYGSAAFWLPHAALTFAALRRLVPVRLSAQLAPVRSCLP